MPLTALLAAIVLNAANPEKVIDLGPSCDGGYATFEVRSFARNPTLRVSYATHPDGLGPKGDFWRETAARYLGPDIDLPILPANIDRYELYAIDHAGTFRAPLLQGLVRYVRLRLDNPADGASVELDGFRLDNDKVHSAGERQGAFACSDDGLNRIWEASVRTCELSAIPSYVAKHVTPAVTTLPYLADGAKRDRLVWSGDLWWAERNMFYGFRTDEPYMRGSIRMLAANRTPEGYVQACPWPEQPPPKTGEYGPFPSDEFAAWFIPVLWDYHLYRDDLPLLRETWPVTRDLVGYLKLHLRADGVFEQRRETSKHAAGLVFGGTSCHHRAYMNILLWFTYEGAAKIADELGHAAEAETWRRDAARLAAAIRVNFWDEAKGHFVLSIEEPRIGLEANALALSSGFATATEAARIMPQVTYIGHGKFQAIAARGKFMYGDAKGALKMFADHNWFKLVADDWRGAHLTSECTGLKRTGWGDEAHPDTAVAGILSAYVLGVEPVEPGYRKFRFSPPPDCGVTSASGRVPTPHGEIVASWRRGADGKVEKSLQCPPGTVCVEPSDYLDAVATAVSAYTPERVADYVARVEKRGVWEHGFPRFAANLGFLVARGFAPERKDQLRRLMDICAREMPRSVQRGNRQAGNDFSVKEIVWALVELERAGTYPKDVTDGWRAAFAAMKAADIYTCQPKVGIGTANNWCVFGAASEQARLATGMGGSTEFVERYVADQLRFFDANGMYKDPHQPMVYDLVTRLQYAMILHFGYAGPSRAKVEELMLKSAEPTLALQSATGEIPYGGRSNQFLHNETCYAALCEWYAGWFARRGDRALASRFRAAATRAMDSFRRWTAARPIRHVKNRFPTETKYGCEGYAYFDKYMVTAGSWVCFAARFADPSVPCADRPEPDGVFVTSDDFHRVLANAGGYTAEFDWNAQTGYDANGLGRLVRRGAPPAICLSTPCPVKSKYHMDVTNDAPVAIAPWGWKAYRLVSATKDGVELTDGKAVWSNRLSAEGLEMRLVGAGPQEFKLLAFAFDGETRPEIACDGKTLAVTYGDWVCRYTTDGKIADTGKTYGNRNGHYRRFEAKGADRLTVKIAIEPRK